MVGAAAINGFIAAAAANQTLRPDVLLINDDLAKISPFIIGRNFIRVLVTLVIRPVYFPFESIEATAESVQEVFMTSVNIDDLCGFDPSEAFVAIFDNLFNVEFLNFIIEAQGLDLEA